MVGTFDLKRFDTPDEVRTFEKGRLAVVKVGGTAVGVGSGSIGMGVRFTLRMEFRTPGGTFTVTNRLHAGNLAAIGLEPGSRFEVEDLVTGHRWDWGDANYVRLDAFTRPAHVLHVVRGSR